MNLTYPILGIDYGVVHTGLAIARSIIAEPIGTVPTVKTLEIIKTYVQKEHITGCVIGLSENVMAASTKQFGDQVAANLGVPVFYHDETLSSYDTRVKAAQAGMKKKKREQKLDHYVAAAILQDYLDSHVSS